MGGRRWPGSRPALGARRPDASRCRCDARLRANGHRHRAPPEAWGTARRGRLGHPRRVGRCISHCQRKAAPERGCDAVRRGNSPDWFGALCAQSVAAPAATPSRRPVETRTRCRRDCRRAAAGPHIKDRQRNALPRFLPHTTSEINVSARGGISQAPSGVSAHRTERRPECCPVVSCSPSDRGFL